jgi:hypothetical protein
LLHHKRIFNQDTWNEITEEQNMVFTYLRTGLLIAILGLVSLSCLSETDSGQQATQVAQQVEATVNAQHLAQTAGQTETPPPPLPTITIVPDEPTSIIPGSISGFLSYPSEFIPALTVVAYRIENGKPNGVWFSFYTMEGDSTYQIDNIPPGKYWVVAYLMPDAVSGIPGNAAGYTEASLCGYVLGCAESLLLEVEVISGEITSDIDPGDWYAPEGSFPGNPLTP